MVWWRYLGYVGVGGEWRRMVVGGWVEDGGGWVKDAGGWVKDGGG